MIDAKTYFSLEDFKHHSLFRETGPIWDALACIKEFLQRYPHSIESNVPTEVHLINPHQISIGSGTLIEPGVMIVGPCIIGKNCTIRHGAYIRENVILGDDCHIGHSSEVKGSIFLNGAAATHFTYVGDSILGNAVNLGAGVKCANLRLDRKEVSIVAAGKKWKTGLKKLGAIIGDRAQIGCNSVINPGTFIGKECFSHPLMHISGIVPSQSLIDAKGVRPIDQKILEKLLWKSTAQK